MNNGNTSHTPRSLRTTLLLAAAGILVLGGAAAALADVETGFDYAQVDLRAAVWTDKSGNDVYNKNENMTVGFQTNADAYAVVYRIDTEGEVTVLWPRSRMDDGFVFGGHEYVLPVAGARPLRTAAAEGEGFVQAIVSRYPFDLRALEVDFHHDNTGGRAYGFRVVGDPFLAMNEVNYAITGLEDTEDYVVTDYAAYFVHRAVEHPRYLCNQCHFDDDWRADPYDDICRLDITVDYRWSNGWWNTYGYYPVYYYPSYVYIDPWNRRPWVNFWYDPWWYGPTVNVCYWPSYAYPWYDSPYYGGNWSRGPARYRPLSPGPADDGTRTKVRERGPLAPMVAARGSAGVRGEATRGTAARTKDDGGTRTAWRGEARADRDRPALDTAVRTRGTAGLRIRDGSPVRGVETGERPRVRHTAGDARNPSAVVPVTGGPTGGGRRDARTGAAAGTTPRTGEDRGARTRGGEADGRTIKPVEPRQRGTRIWNTGRSGDAGRRPEQVRPGSRTGGSDPRRDGAVRPRSGDDDGKATRKGGDTRTRPGSTGDSGSRDSGVRDGGSSRSGGGTRDSGVRDGGSRSGGSDARSGGGTRDSGVRDGGSRSGGSDARSGGGTRDSGVRDGGSRSGGNDARSSGGTRDSGVRDGGSRGGSRADGGGRGGR